MTESVHTLPMLEGSAKKFEYKGTLNGSAKQKAAHPHADRCTSDRQHQVDQI